MTFPTWWWAWKSCSLCLNRPCRDGFVWGCLHGLPVSSQFIFLRIHSFLSCLPTLDSHVLVQRNIWYPEDFIFGGCWIFHETFCVVSPDIMQDNWWSSPDWQKMLDFVKGVAINDSMGNSLEALAACQCGLSVYACYQGVQSALNEWWHLLLLIQWPWEVTRRPVKMCSYSNFLVSFSYFCAWVYVCLCAFECSAHEDQEGRSWRYRA